MEDGKVTGTESEQLSYSFSDSHNLGEMRESYADPIVGAVSNMSKSINREALFSQNTGLPGKSFLDRLETGISTIIPGVGVATKTLTPGAEYLNPDIGKMTTMRVSFGKMDKAINKLNRLANRPPIRKL